MSYTVQVEIGDSTPIEWMNYATVDSLDEARKQLSDAGQRPIGYNKAKRVLETGTARELPFGEIWNE